MDTAEPIPTLLQSGGPLLSFEQFRLFLCGAASEGLVHDVEPVPDSVRRSAWFQREWHDLLAAIALFGPARVVFPAHLASEADIESLLELEVAEILVAETTGDLRTQLAKTYGEAFDRCRRLEQHPSSTPLISLNQPIPTGRGNLEVEILWGEVQYYVERLLDRVLPLVDGLQDIFGYYRDANQLAVYEGLNDYNERIVPDAMTRWAHPNQPPAEIDTSNLLRDMGLYLRDRGALEAGGFQIAGISYTPHHLEAFQEVNRTLTSEPDGFSEFAARGLELSLFDRSEFLGIHAFWSSFFELLNMLAVSSETANPLYLPSDTSTAAPQPRPNTIQTSDSLRIYRLFLAETGKLPRPSTIREAAQLRSDTGLSALRSNLAQWTGIAREGGLSDVNVMKEIRRDVEKAADQLRRSEHLSRAGRIVSLISVPVAVVDALHGSAFGAGLTPVGPAIDAYNARKLHRASWIRFGDIR